MDCSFGCFRHQLSLQTIMSRGKSYKALSPSAFGLHVPCKFCLVNLLMASFEEIHFWMLCNVSISAFLLA